MSNSRKTWQVLYKGSVEGFDNSAHDYWKDKSASEKFKETKSLVDAVMKLKGIKYTDASRLLRTTAVLKRQ